MKKPREAKRMSDKAVKERTGKTWVQWFAILDKAGAKTWRHKEISAYLAKTHKVGPWWCQMVAVPYEHARGIREKFQKCDGQFAASGSRTLNVAIARLYQFWTDEKLRHRWLPDAEMEITTATSNKSLRAKWDGGKSRLSVNFYAKGSRKSQAAVDHMKLATSKECAEMKTYWFEALNRLQEILKDQPRSRKSLLRSAG
ncbi:MAG: DUF4287 domain-containing protein [Candidatus Acidiferrales bacterium]